MKKILLTILVVLLASAGIAAAFQHSGAPFQHPFFGHAGQHHGSSHAQGSEYHHPTRGHH